MYCYRFTLAFCLFIGIVPFTSFGQGNFVKDEAIVQFEEKISLTERGSKTIPKDSQRWNLLKDSFNLQRIESLSGSKRSNSRSKTSTSKSQLYLLKFQGPVDVKKHIKALKKTGFFVFAEPNYIGEGGGVSNICKKQPNDEFYKRQWEKKENSGNRSSITIEKGWGLTTGDSSVLVAILDSGIETDHPEFSGRLWRNNKELPNKVDSDNNGFVDDTAGWNFVKGNNDLKDHTGHGTHVSGIFAANGNNEIGYAGVDWNCHILPLKVLNKQNRGKVSWWIRGINYAIDQNVDAINMSLGSAKNSLGLKITLNKWAQQIVQVIGHRLFTDQVIREAITAIILIWSRPVIKFMDYRIPKTPIIQLYTVVLQWRLHWLQEQ